MYCRPRNPSQPADSAISYVRTMETPELCRATENVHKRLRGTPTGLTPRRPSKRTPLRLRDQLQEVERRRLTYTEPKKGPPGPWEEVETKALVEFILFYESDNKWPSHKRQEYWKGAGNFVRIRSKSQQLRTGKLPALL